MLHPDPLAVARFTHPALSSTHSLPRNSNPVHIHLYLVLSRSLLLPRAQHVLSTLQQPFQTADAIFSGSWQSFVGEGRPSPPKKEPHVAEASDRQIGAAVHQPLRERSPLFRSSHARPAAASRFYLRPPRVAPTSTLFSFSLVLPSSLLSHLPSPVFLLFLFLSLPPPSPSRCIVVHWTSKR